MQRFKNILLVAENTSDFSPAFVRAGELAERNGAVVTVIHVLEALPATSRFWLAPCPSTTSSTSPWGKEWGSWNAWLNPCGKSMLQLTCACSADPRSSRLSVKCCESSVIW